MLCGGASTRLGTDKVWAEVGGRPLVAGVIGALRAAGAAEVVTVGGDPDRLAALDVVAVADGYPGEGPLGGILTALRAAAGDPVVVLAADLVHPSAELVELLVASAGGAEVAVAVGTRREPLLAAWPRALLGAVERAFAAGQRSPSRLLDSLSVAEVPLGDPARVTDVDTPADLARARQLRRPERGR